MNQGGVVIGLQIVIECKLYTPHWVIEIPLNKVSLSSVLDRSI